MNISEAYKLFSARTDRSLGMKVDDLFSKLDIPVDGVVWRDVDFWPAHMTACAFASKFLDLCRNDDDLNAALCAYVSRFEAGRISPDHITKEAVLILKAMTPQGGRFQNFQGQ